MYTRYGIEVCMAILFSRTPVGWRDISGALEKNGDGTCTMRPGLNPALPGGFIDHWIFPVGYWIFRYFEIAMDPVVAAGCAGAGTAALAGANPGKAAGGAGRRDEGMVRSMRSSASSGSRYALRKCTRSFRPAARCRSTPDTAFSAATKTKTTCGVTSPVTCPATSGES